MSSRTTDAQYPEGNPRRATAPAMREQVRLLGRVSLHNSWIFTSRIQPGAQRMSSPPRRRGASKIPRTLSIWPDSPSSTLPACVLGRCVAPARRVLSTAATAATAGPGPHGEAEPSPTENYAYGRKGSECPIAAPNPAKQLFNIIIIDKAAKLRYVPPLKTGF